ncbi:MAG TPA: ABC transporter ATP-binding protein [Pyrinomonadaceae bacterium]|nr:ABC transporter ATP-binding protein [Pyrinomonadaceae bacterium]
MKIVREPVTAVPEPAISIRHLSKTYPTPFRRLRAFFRRPVKEPVEALRDVSFDVREGEIFGLIGRNGAGKTTLTKIVATLVQPTTGRVSVRGSDSVLHDEQVRQQIGLATAEERSFYWRLTGEQNLMFFARLHGLSDRIAKQRIRELFAKLELEDLARRRFGEMSTGNKQRLAVARAMLSSPPVLLLDEPTRSLDPLAAARMRELIRSLAHHDPPVTVLLTSHNLAEVETLCERVAIISRGSIRALDTPQHLRSLTSKTEQVHVTVSGLNGSHESEKISFTRQTGDNQLDERLRDLQSRGALIVDVEVERASLFDVLELYETRDTNLKPNESQ